LWQPFKLVNYTKNGINLYNLGYLFCSAKAVCALVGFINAG